MNVKELIAVLSKFPPDLPVLMHSYDNEWGDHSGADTFVVTQQEVEEFVRHDPHPDGNERHVVAVTKPTPVVLLWCKQERESYLKYNDGYTVHYNPPL